ncbi:Phosphatidylserine decarboxylase proenzyme 3 [Beauveria bassiana]|nr:Phosphatidylserine decarboxylase proenzyme 3 [Beauveria bassiana]
MTELVMDTQLGPMFENGAVASFHLSPQDYPLPQPRGRSRQAVPQRAGRLPGRPGRAAKRRQILTRNRRSYVVIETAEFGDVLFIGLGATDVGSVRIHEKWQKKGTDELGLFQFGGSSIIVAFQKGRMQIDEDLLKLSQARIQDSVEMGMSLGYALSTYTGQHWWPMLFQCCHALHGTYWLAPYAPSMSQTALYWYYPVFLVEYYGEP